MTLHLPGPFLFPLLTSLTSVRVPPLLHLHPFLLLLSVRLLSVLVAAFVHGVAAQAAGLVVQLSDRALRQFPGVAVWTAVSDDVLQDRSPSLPLQEPAVLLR